MPLKLPETLPRYDAATFIRADANAAAWRAGTAWLNAHESVMTVCGPAGAGKTHFVQALCEGRSIAVITDRDFEQSGTEPGVGLIFIDDLPVTRPEVFLTALESGIEAGRRFILAGEGHPSSWSRGLKDLRTRIEAAPRATLSDPDEALIRLVIAKGFRDRQVEVNSAVIDYAVPRLTRTFAAARRFVALADKAALEEKRKITTPLVQKVLDNLSEGDPAA
ncbi:MAG: hypothetical protein AAFW68_03580 [Pseudomonadota bacterium]